MTAVVVGVSSDVTLTARPLTRTTRDEFVVAPTSSSCCWDDVNVAASTGSEQHPDVTSHVGCSACSEEPPVAQFAVTSVAAFVAVSSTTCS